MARSQSQLQIIEKNKAQVKQLVTEGKTVVEILKITKFSKPTIFKYAETKDIPYQHNICIECGSKFVAGKAFAICCPKCKTIHASKIRNQDLLNGIEGKDYIRCAICGIPSTEISVHLSQTHHITTTEYTQTYHKPFMCETMQDYKSNQITGSKNPGYQHGGKLSPFSKKYILAASTNISEVAKKAADTRTENENDTTTLEYWLKQTNGNKKEAEKLLQNRQRTFSKEICIQKYGKKKGEKIWTKRQEKWLANLASKSPEEIERINRLKMGSPYSISKGEKEIVQALRESNISIIHQFSKFVDKKKSFIYDICYGNKLIEYNGDYWHCNPKKYQPDYYQQKQHKYAHEIWERDAKKVTFAEEAGYKVLVIWESDYKKDPDITVRRCLDFLQE